MYNSNGRANNMVFISTFKIEKYFFNKGVYGRIGVVFCP